ncbi:aminoglycoside phosphotransferase family protein [Streptomyces diacarni]|uniref:Hydroxyurea phosphotransferase n=1 Tax=Streptomyces diacarni TaxID=2800381 RepID=A0A367EUI2_9ACTN|nr:aminoglycoside phosphotransferase family protein [Streptomyces diacarni]RCG21265.1 hydroxyurea phosphotransferase [Streptomyces diacarni]
MSRTDSGRAWLSGLPALVEKMRTRWRLRLGAPFHGGSCSWAAPAARADGSRAVLKLTWPHPEARTEGTALSLWNGDGAVRVHEQDTEHYALLLERVEPGAELGRSDHLPAEDRLLSAAEVLRRLWSADAAKAAELGIDALADITDGWARVAARQASRTWPAALDAGLFRLAERLFRALPSTAARTVVLHGDFNPGNLLSAPLPARRTPWLAIDPKPMTGDPAFDPWPLLEQVDDPFAHPDPHRVLRHRTALFADAVGEDADRVRAWAVARHVEYALWSVDEDADLRHSITLMRQARVLADVAAL